MAADGSIVVDVKMDASKAEKSLARLKDNIKKTEQSIADLQGERSPFAEQMERYNKSLARASARLTALRREQLDMTSVTIGGKNAPGYAEAKARLDALIPQIREQEGEIERLEAQFRQAAGAVDKYDQKLKKAESTLARQKDEAGELVRQIEAQNSASARMGRALDAAGEKMGRLTGHMRRLAAGAFVFSVISSGLRKMREYLVKAVKANAEASAAVARLKGALLTLAQPLVNVVLPVLTAFVNVLARVAAAIAQVVSALFGTTAEESANAAENLYQETEAIGGVGAAAKKAGKQLAAFDEINKLSADTAGGAGGGSAAGGGIKPDFDNSFIGKELDKIATLVGGALLAVGAILTFSGANIPVGLALMAAGAITLGKVAAENWGAIAEALRGPLGLIVLVLGGALLALGAVLTFTGANIPLGLGLMAVGAVGLGAAMTANWEAIQAALQGPLGIITGMVSTALLVLGAILTFTGANIPLGIGLLFAGAIGLATTMAANWEAIQTLLQGPIGAITAIVSAALLVLGAVLTFTGANLPLGIGLLVLGAVGLATTIAANWETIQAALQGPLGVITAIISTALLVIGAVLLFSGAAVPLGLGMIVVGAVGLAGAIAANWEVIQTTLGGKIDAITALVSAALLVLGVILIFTGAGIPLGLGMLIAGGAGLAATVAPNWDFILEKVQDAWASVKEWWNTHVAKYFTWDYWKGLGKNCLDGLFGGFDLGSKVKNWGKSMIGEVEDTFGIHSPSTKFKELGEYMMAGLLGGVNDHSAAVETAFAALFAAALALCTQNTELMQNNLELFLLFLSADFVSKWSKTWDDCNQKARDNIRDVISEIDTLNARLASIERSITITITTIQQTVSAPGASGKPAAGPKAAAVARAARSVQGPALPALARGAVIPPNREFMAVLGDQKSGNNLELPEGLLRRIVREEAGGGQAQPIILECDGIQFAKLIYKLSRAESRRAGVSLTEV